MTVNTRAEVDSLLKLYRQYTDAFARSEALGREVAKRKLTGKPADTAAYTAAKAEVQAISDAMTFATPTVWAMYKYEAYIGEAQPIRTLHDFRLHCSKPGYICTKRFELVNQALLERGETPLSDAVGFSDDTELPGVYDVLDTLAADTAFMQQWDAYEYYRDGERVAKWENYR